MKKTLSILVLILLLVSCGKGRKATIKGAFSGVINDTVLLEIITTQERRIVDSTVTNDRGRYKFRITVPESSPVFFNILCKGSTIPLIVAPGERVTVNSLCDLVRNYTVEGSQESVWLREFNNFYIRSMMTLDSLSQLYVNTPALPANETVRKGLLDQYLKNYYRIKREHIGFILSHASSITALYALYQRLPSDMWLSSEKDDLIYYQVVADSVSMRYPDASRVKALQKEIDERRQALALLDQIQQQHNQGGPQFPEVELTDTYGKKQKLSELSGKTILLHFWSVKDKNYPIVSAELRELYKTYTGKGLEIYQISLGDDKAMWINAVQEQKLPWINVYDPRGVGGVAAMSYNVREVPSNVLIDKNGAIVSRNVFGDKLHSKIAELTR